MLYLTNKREITYVKNGEGNFRGALTEMENHDVPLGGEQLNSALRLALQGTWSSQPVCVYLN